MTTRFAAFFLIAICLGIPGLAQKTNVQFHSINSVGLTNGQSGGHMLLQTVNGVIYNSWFAGIGFGIDYYPYRSLPLFADLRKYVGASKDAFAYVDLGYNLDANNKPGKDVFYSTYHYSSGLYSDFGIGYSMKINRRSSLLVSTGFSYKNITNHITVAEECLVAPCPVDYSKYQYGNGRVSLKAGIDF
jgi:hypothetical protein